MSSLSFSRLNLSGPSPRAKKRKRGTGYLMMSESAEPLPIPSLRLSEGADLLDSESEEEGPRSDIGDGSTMPEPKESGVNNLEWLDNEELALANDNEGEWSSSSDSEDYLDTESEHMTDISDVEESDVREIRVADTGDGADLQMEKPTDGAEAPGPGNKSGSKGSKRHRENVLKEWINLREDFLDELIRHEAPLLVGSHCPKCGDCDPKHESDKEDLDLEKPPSVRFRCEDCIENIALCKDCILKGHQSHPFHRLKEFSGEAWQKISLRKLGYVLMLTHDGYECPEPSAPTLMTVLDVHGIHKILMSFCGCVKSYDKDNSQRNQLLRHRLFPATVLRPKTVATFRLLKFFHQTTLQSKISAYDFYQSLVKYTDFTGTAIPKKRYGEFVRIVREYRNLKMMQRAGILEGMGEREKSNHSSEGKLAVECPACPHPGINLPRGWEVDQESWKHALFLMVDANFRLKSKANRAKDDVELGPGWSFFVEENAYKKHLKENVEEKEIRYCDSGLRAVDHANLKGSKVYEASGVVAVQCRHMMIRKNGVGDLQKGEKFANVDYVLLSTLRAVKTKKIVISYDINCQYHRNFQKRMDKYRSDLKLDLNAVEILSVIPKMHLPGHGDSCQTKYSLNLREHVGRTDGENIERGWAYLNPISMSTKEMGKGSRHDTINDHLASSNWDRTVTLGRILKGKLKDALVEHEKQKAAHIEFSTAFPQTVLTRIQNAIKEWNSDPNHSIDPYKEIRTTSSTNDVKKLLEEEEIRDRNREGRAFDRNKELTATHWLVVGFEIEENQEKLKEILNDLKESSTKAQRTLADEKNALLLMRIKAWISAQRTIMPNVVLSSVEDEDEEEDEFNNFTLGRNIGLLPRATDIALRMPSSIERDMRMKMCAPDLIVKETRLRIAQAEDALQDIRRILRRGITLVNKKIQHVRGAGQRNNTRMSDNIKNVKVRVDVIGRRYNRARNALLRLDPDGKWKESLKELPKTVEEMQHPSTVKKSTGQGKYIAPWIWMMPGAGSYSTTSNTTVLEDDMPINEGSAGESENVDEGLCVEWARSFARVERWKEEIVLLREEMRRVLAFLRYKGNEWLQMAERYAIEALTSESEEANFTNKRIILAGRIAYANRQGNVMKNLAATFANDWKDSPAE